MRASEFLSEEAKAIKTDSLILKYAFNDGALLMKAFERGTGSPLAFVKFVKEKKELYPEHLWVHDDYRNRSIAKTMYDALKSEGYIINRSHDQTKAGSGFWDKHRGENAYVWEDLRQALQFATDKHKGQTRSGGEPYIGHPVRVAQTIEQYKQSHNLDALIAAAYLHDTIEDTDTTHEALHDLFGGLVASLVLELTSDKEKIAKMGKSDYLAKKMAHDMSSYALVIKLADRLDNVQDIATAKSPAWRARYKAETEHILDYIENNRVLSGTHQKLVSLIRDKIKEIPVDDVNEEVLDEMPLPADWDPQQMKQGASTFKSRLQYALDRAKKLGTGSSRVATTIEYQGRPTVLKIAKNQKGLAQNSVEADILSDGYASQLGILIPIIDYDEQNREPTWVHTELAQKATDKQLCKAIGCDNLDQLVNMAWAITGKKKYVGNYQSYISFLRQRGVPEERIEQMSEYANTLADLNSNFDVELGDFSRAANWGFYQGKPVIIDIGFNSNVLKQYY